MSRKLRAEHCVPSKVHVHWDSSARWELKERGSLGDSLSMGGNST